MNTRLWARRILAAVVFAAGLVGAFAQRHLLADAGRRLDSARIDWVVVAVVLEALSLAAFARLQRWLLRVGGVRVAWTDMAEISLASNALSLTLPGGAALAAAWSFRQLRKRGADRLLAGWVVLIAGALSSFALFVVLASGAVVAGGRGPVASLRWLAVSLACIPLLAAIGSAAMTYIPAARRAGRRWFETHHEGWLGRFLERVRLVQPTAVQWGEAFGLALANWVADLGCLIASVSAVGGKVPWSGILVCYGLGRLAASLPITPGGLAVVEGSLSGLLIAYGMPSVPAVAAVLLYRAISFWGLVPIGWAIYGLFATGRVPSGLSAADAG